MRPPLAPILNLKLQHTAAAYSGSLRMCLHSGARGAVAGADRRCSASGQAGGILDPLHVAWMIHFSHPTKMHFFATIDFLSTFPQ